MEPIMQSKYGFVRTELRTLQNMCNGDNERFLNMLADMIGKRDETIVDLKNQINLRSWQINPDRSGGQFSEDEINNSQGWK